MQVLSRIQVLLLLGVVVFPLASQIRSPDRKCDFNSYHPLKIGTPIRGGYEDLAIERVTPTYPEQAQQNGIGGQVDAPVLVNRAGDVVRVCALEASVDPFRRRGCVEVEVPKGLRLHLHRRLDVIPPGSWAD